MQNDESQNGGGADGQSVIEVPSLPCEMERCVLDRETFCVHCVEGCLCGGVFRVLLAWSVV
jgi:hypothetical protein